MLGPLGWAGGPHTLLSRGRHHIERGAGGTAVTHKRKNGILTVYTDVSPLLWACTECRSPAKRPPAQPRGPNTPGLIPSSTTILLLLCCCLSITDCTMNENYFFFEISKGGGGAKSSRGGGCPPPPPPKKKKTLLKQAACLLVTYMLQPPKVSLCGEVNCYLPSLLLSSLSRNICVTIVTSSQ